MPTTSANTPDQLEEDLAELVRAAQQDIDGIRRGEEDTGELIEDSDTVTFVLVAPGYRRAEIRVTTEAHRLRVEAYDFGVTRSLPCAVDPSTARSTYLNGVLSVRADKTI